MIIKNQADDFNIKFEANKVYPELENLKVKPSLEQQDFKSEKYGYDEVIVEPIEAENLSVIPSVEEQRFKGIFKDINVKPVTADIDKNIQEENIRSNINILGKKGTFTQDATASEYDLLKGKTAYANGEKLTGVYEPIDTSDATATPNDILESKTAYVNGEKVTGAIVGTYDTAVPEMIGRSITTNALTIDDINLKANIAIRVDTITSLKIYKINQETITSNNYVTITPTILGTNLLVTGSGKLSAEITNIDNVPYLRCYVAYYTTATKSGIYTFLLNLNTLACTNEFITGVIYNEGSGNAQIRSITVIPKKDNMVIYTGSRKNSGYMFAGVYWVKFDTPTSYTSTQIYNKYYNDAVGSAIYNKINIAADGKTIGVFLDYTYPFGSSVCVIKLSDDYSSFSYLVNSNSRTSNTWVLLLDENHYIEGNMIKDIVTGSQVATAPFTVGNGRGHVSQGILIGRYYYFKTNNSTDVFVYEWNSILKTLTTVNTISTNDKIILHYADEILYETADNIITGFTLSKEKGTLLSVNINGKEFYNTEYADDIQPSHVFSGLRYYSKDGLQVGTYTS